MSSDIPSLLELTENIDALESTHSADPATSMVLKKIFGSDILINFERGRHQFITALLRIHFQPYSLLNRCLRT